MCPCLRWTVEHYATVTLTFIDKGNETELKIECRAVPESEEDRTREGWQRYYCQAIKQTFGFGARLCWAPTSTITLFWLTFIFFFLPYVQMSTWNVTLLKNRLNIAPCSTVLVLVSVFKKNNKKKQTQISEKKMNRYYAWHGVWKGEIRVILFTYHLRRCVRMVLFVAQ